MRVDPFDFDLPEDRIALRPCKRRDQGRLLYVPAVRGEPFADLRVGDLTDHLKAGDGLVFNESRVLSASLEGVRIRGHHEARVSVNLHKRLSGHEWLCFSRPAKKMQKGDRLHFGGTHNVCLFGALKGEVLENRGGGEIKIGFELTGLVLDQHIEAVGQMPLPPYIVSKRPADESDRLAYQTVYAKEDGSVAAPTAGLHFTDQLLAALEARGVHLLKVVLHVGAGTFLPVKTDHIENHKMHSEWGEVRLATANKIKDIKQQGGQICAVGTTSLRLLETAARESGEIGPWRGETDIFITPGFNFQVVDKLMTNFHLPKSTLFMLVSAFSGLERMHKAYAHGIQNNYRFYSYGDACLLERQTI